MIELLRMYPTSFRRQVLKIKTEEKLSLAEVAKRFGIGVASVMRWSKKIEATTKRNKPATKIDMEALRQDVESNPPINRSEPNAWESADMVSGMLCSALV